MKKIFFSLIPLIGILLISDTSAQARSKNTWSLEKCQEHCSKKKCKGNNKTVGACSKHCRNYENNISKVCFAEKKNHKKRKSRKTKGWSKDKCFSSCSKKKCRDSEVAEQCLKYCSRFEDKTHNGRKISKKCFEDLVDEDEEEDDDEEY